MNNGMMDHVKERTPEIILAVLFILAMGFSAYAIHIDNEHFGNWSEEVAGQILAALLTIITGSRLLGSKNGNGNGSSAPPPPPMGTAPAPEATK